MSSTYAVVIRRSATGAIEDVIGRGMWHLVASELAALMTDKHSIRDGCTFVAVLDRDLPRESQ